MFDHSIRADAEKFVGAAFTVRNVPVREDLTDRASMVSPNSPLHGTIDNIPAGAVVMIDMLGVTSCGGSATCS